MQTKLALLLGFIVICVFNIFFLALEGDIKQLPTFLPSKKQIHQIHISLGQEQNSINIMWVMLDDVNDCWVDITEKRFNLTQQNLLEYQGNTGKTYKRYFYTTLINDLESDKINQYQIKCIHEGKLTSSPKYTFKSPPGIKSKITALSICDFQTNLYSDPKDKYSKRKKPNILPHLYQESKRLDNYDLVLHGGDIAYDL